MFCLGCQIIRIDTLGELLSSNSSFSALFIVHDLIYLVDISLLNNIRQIVK